MKKTPWTISFSGKPDERAFTLTELAIVLGVVGILIGGIWVAASSVYNNRNIGRAQQELITIVQNIRAFNPNQTSLSGGGDLTAYLAAGGAFPSDMVSQAVTSGTTSTYPLSPWATPVRVQAYTVSHTNDSFWIEFDAGGNRVPASACLAFLGAMVGPGSDPGLIGIATNSGGSSWYGGSPNAGHTTIAGLDVTSLAGACGDPTFLYMLQ